MKVLITGVAGFIGHALAKRLLKEGIDTVGIDNFSQYYSPVLKRARLHDLMATDATSSSPAFTFEQVDLSDAKSLEKLFEHHRFTHVVNLAGQPGVRYSLQNPSAYVQTNVVGFANLLELCRRYGVNRLVYASSSSVYGQQDHVPFCEDDNTDHPVSLYAATKKSDEVMAYSYSHLFGIQTVGLRFFTVYGPWGRPDMAPLKFMAAIDEGQEIQVYNQGQMLRDFTYIDDIVEGIYRVLTQEADQGAKAKIYNIGNGHPVQLLHFIHCIEKAVGKPARMRLMGMQAGDVTRTYADTAALRRDYGYCPATPVEEGVKHLYDWYEFHKALL